MNVIDFYAFNSSSTKRILPKMLDIVRGSRIASGRQLRIPGLFFVTVDSLIPFCARLVASKIHGGEMEIEGKKTKITPYPKAKDETSRYWY